MVLATTICIDGMTIPKHAPDSTKAIMTVKNMSMCGLRAKINIESSIKNDPSTAAELSPAR